MSIQTLTVRQREVLELVSQGLANKQIAVLLGISENAIKAHVHEILLRLGCPNRAAAAAIWAANEQPEGAEGSGATAEDTVDPDANDLDGEAYAPGLEEWGYPDVGT